MLFLLMCYYVFSLILQFGRKKKKYRGKTNSTSSSKESEKKEVAKDEDDEEEEEEEDDEDGDLSKYKLDVSMVAGAGNSKEQILYVNCFNAVTFSLG